MLGLVVCSLLDSFLVEIDVPFLESTTEENPNAFSVSVYSCSIIGVWSYWLFGWHIFCIISGTDAMAVSTSGLTPP